MPAPDAPSDARLVAPDVAAGSGVWHDVASLTRPTAWMGLATTLVAGVPLAVGQVTGTSTVPNPWAWWSAYVLFVLAFLVVLAEPPGPGDRDLGPLLVVILVVMGLAVVVLAPSYGLGIVLPIVAVTTATFVFGLRVALMLTAVQVAVVAWAWSRGPTTAWTDALVEATVWGGFMTFAVLTVAAAEREARARLELAAANERLAEANERLQAAHELLEATSRNEERVRISRDLHDLLGHQLTALTLQLEAAGHTATGDLAGRISQSRGLARGLLNDVRAVVGQLREDTAVPPGVPPAVAPAGRAMGAGVHRNRLQAEDAMAAMQAATAVPAPPRIHLDVDLAALSSDPAVATTAVRLVQELVTNCVRHADAQNLWIDVVADTGATMISGRDDGRGVDEVMAGNGVTGIRERVHDLGGAVTIRSSPGAGFLVDATIPTAEPVS